MAKPAEPLPKEPAKKVELEDDFDLNNFDFGGIGDMNDVADINLDGFDLNALDDDNTQTVDSTAHNNIQPEPVM